MDMNTKHQLTLKVLPRYLKASRKEKSKILDEYCANTSYNRKYAIWKLSLYQMHEKDRPKNKVRRRDRKYGLDVQKALEKIWKVCDRICSARLHPFIPEMISVLKRFGEIHLVGETEAKLLMVSRATIDRLLREARKREGLRLRGTTKPGTLLKHEIPLRTGRWEESAPGFGEIDLVVHCGETTAGHYAHTLNYTDIATAWSEREAVLGRAQPKVHEALKEIARRLPFPLRGIDSDNDSSFINDQILRYCRREKIVFTRSRPYKKNDNAHVEQKNWTTVRKIIGYVRLDSQRQVDMMNELYSGALRDYTNFFQPVQKLLDKKRVGARKVKKHDRARTPYQRVLEAEEVSEEIKEELKKHYMSLNPVELRREIERGLERIFTSVEKRYRRYEEQSSFDKLVAFQ
jgi:hypothetical protein